MRNKPPPNSNDLLFLPIWWVGNLGASSAGLAWDCSCSCSYLTVRLGLEGSNDFIYMPGSWCWLRMGNASALLYLPPILQWTTRGFFTAWRSRGSKRLRAPASRPLGAQVSELVQHHFYHILLVKASHQASTDHRGWSNRSCLLWGGVAISYCRGARTGRHDSLGAILVTVYNRLFRQSTTGYSFPQALFPESSVPISLKFVLPTNYMIIWYSGVNRIVNGLSSVWSVTDETRGKAKPDTCY